MNLHQSIHLKATKPTKYLLQQLQKWTKGLKSNTLLLWATIPPKTTENTKNEEQMTLHLITHSQLLIIDNAQKSNVNNIFSNLPPNTNASQRVPKCKCSTVQYDLVTRWESVSISRNLWSSVFFHPHPNKNPNHSGSLGPELRSNETLKNKPTYPTKYLTKENPIQIPKTCIDLKTKIRGMRGNTENQTLWNNGYRSRRKELRFQGLTAKKTEIDKGESK